MSVFVLVCVIPPAVNLPNSILTPGLPVGRKKTRVAAIEANKQNWSEITDSTRSKKPMYSLKKLYDQSHIKTWINQIISSSPSIVNCARSCCVSLIWQPAWIWTAVPILATSCQYYNTASLNCFTLKDFKMLQT